MDILNRLQPWQKISVFENVVCHWSLLYYTLHHISRRLLANIPSRLHWWAGLEVLIVNIAGHSLILLKLWPCNQYGGYGCNLSTACPKQLELRLWLHGEFYQVQVHKYVMKSFHQVINNVKLALWNAILISTKLRWGHAIMVLSKFMITRKCQVLLKLTICCHSSHSILHFCSQL